MNQFFIQNRDNFPRAYEWATKQIMDGNVQLTASCQAQSDRILKNPDGPHEWDRPCDFARTAACVMRLGMLMATGLDERRFHHLNFAAVQENRRAFRIRGEQERINERQFLAADRVETNSLISSFNVMYAYRYMKPFLFDQPQGEQHRCIMIVFNAVHNVIWWIESTLDIVSDGMRVLEGRPFVAVWRYDRAEDRDIEFLLLLDDVDYQNYVPIEEVIEGIRDMYLEDFLR